MTRINLVNVTELYDQHLMAEYRELPRLFIYAKDLQVKGKRPGGLNIPEHYVLGTGHVKFFVNKLKFLERRFSELVVELKNRGFNIQYTSSDIMTEGLDPYWFGDYVPTVEAIDLNRERINERLAAKPGWYRKTMRE